MECDENRENGCGGVGGQGFIFLIGVVEKVVTGDEKGVIEGVNDILGGEGVGNRDQDKEEEIWDV